MSGTATTVTVTGAGGQIGYALLFRIAAGDMLGSGEEMRLRLMEVPEGIRAAVGAALELQDCAFPLLRDVEVTGSAATAFEGCNIALLVGARPRGPGMERADLLAANAGIFGPQGAAINAHAADDVRVVVVGNPANTNALIVTASAPDVPSERITALTRLDHNRAVGQLVDALDTTAGAVRDVTIWGNHSPTQFPDVSHATVAGVPVVDAMAQRWASTAAVMRFLDDEFVPRVARRGAEIIEVRGSSSVASAANAAIEHVRDWVVGIPPGRGWTSAAVVSHGEYGVPEGLVCSFPVTADAGAYRVVAGLEIDDRGRRMRDASVDELIAERDAVRDLGVL